MLKQMQAMANVPHLRSILHTWNVLIPSLSSLWLQKKIDEVAEKSPQQQFKVTRQ
jgi:hypothetical protein